MIDVVGALTDSVNPRDYWFKMKIRVKSEDGLELSTICRQLNRNSDVPADIVKNWMRNRSTIEFLGLWEQLNNADFKLVEFDQFKK